MSEKNYYVSWVDKRTDPWPQWEKIQAGKTDAAVGGRTLQFLADNHREWPGVPFLNEANDVTVADTRMGLFSWPGIPYQGDSRNGRLYTGPTISALFHPASRFCNLNGLDRVYILYQPETQDSPHELLQKVLLGLGKARSLPRLGDKVKFVPITGIGDPTDHDVIIRAIEKWLKKDDPFNYGARNAGKITTRITINLSAGTPSMHASWLVLRWNGALGKPQSIIEYVQGDGGLRGQEDGVSKDPLRLVPIDTLAQWIGQKKPAEEPLAKPDAGVQLEELQGAPYDALRQKLDHAALLGLPVLLQGERGTGKTFLAKYYHDRRQFYRQNRGLDTSSADKKKKGDEKSKNVPGERFPEKLTDNNFVTVTLSEFADVETLRDTLFGWAVNSWDRALESFDGLLGEAHEGTLFLDEIHHLDRTLQAALLGPLNSKRYRPKMAKYEVISQFDLVVATNDPDWRGKMADDFRDRIERIVMEVPAYRSFQTYGVEILWKFWDYTLRKRCQECDIPYSEEGPGWVDCRQAVQNLLGTHPLPGNWRDLQRMADNVLLYMTNARDGRPSPLWWDKKQLDLAIEATFSSR